jgi:hypothetical protein
VAADRVATTKTVRTDIGDVEGSVLRDRAGSFSLAVSPKRSGSFWFRSCGDLVVAKGMRGSSRR